MKAYICYEGNNNYFSCYLVLENYHVIAKHICSDESFMAYDLWYRRASLQEKCKEIYGDINIVLPPLNEQDILFHKFNENCKFIPEFLEL